MSDQESTLLYQALLYEDGHPRRTQHILKVYALTKLLGARALLLPEEQRILQAAAILHDIAIKYCKEHCGGDASQHNQKQAAPALVHRFLEQSGYLPEDVAPVLELVLHHHEYHSPRGRLLQLLIEADLIVNCYESELPPDKLQQLESIFQTTAGKELFARYRHGSSASLQKELESSTLGNHRQEN